jgi:hypothetical protein
MFIGARRTLLRKAVSGFDAATTAWINAVIGAGGTVSATQKGNVDTLIKAYKRDGVWSLLDHEWLYACENATQASIDIVGLAVHTLVNLGTSPTFTANRGYQPVLRDGYINLGFAPSGATNYTQNAASFGAYVLTNRTVGNTNALMGTVDGGGNYSFFRANNSNTLEHDLNSSTFNAPANSTAKGNYLFSRTNSTTIVPYKNNAALATSTTGAAGARSTQNWFLFCYNANGTPSTLTDDQVASVFMGGAMNGTQAAAKNADLNAYMSSPSVGANVY